MTSILCVLLLLGNFFVFIYGDVCPDLISRGEWSLKAKQDSPIKLDHPLRFVIVQSAVTFSENRVNCAEDVRSIQKNHIESQNLTDIGYNFAVCENGDVYEGLGWDVAGELLGQYNTRSIAIGVLGNYKVRKSVEDMRWFQLLPAGFSCWMTQFKETGVIEPPNIVLQQLRKLIQCGVNKKMIMTDHRLMGYHYDGSPKNKDNLLYFRLRRFPRFSAWQEYVRA